MNMWLVILFLVPLKDVFNIKMDLMHNIMDIDYNLPEKSILRNLTFFLPLVKLCFGQPDNQCFNLAIQTAFAFTILEDSQGRVRNFNQQYNQSLSIASTTKDRTSLSIFNKRYLIKCKNMQDVAYFNNETITTHKHYFLTMVFEEMKIKLNFDGYLGLQKEYNKNIPTQDYHYAFISYLFNRTQLITRPNYSIYYDYYYGGKIAFGEDNGVYNKCKGNETFESYTSWHCDIRDILIGGNSFSINHYRVQLDSGSSLITAPYEQGLPVLNHLIELLKDCSLKSESTFVFLICDSIIDKKIDTIDDMIIRLDNIDWKIKWKYLFKPTTYNNSSVYISTFLADQDIYHSKENTWIVGMPGFIGNKIIFDYSDCSIGIIQNHNEYVKQEEVLTNKINYTMISISLMIMLFCGVMILLYMKLKFIKSEIN